MNKTIFLLFLAISQSLMSQTIEELKVIRDSLESKRRDLIREATDMIETIDSLDNLMLYAKMKDKAIKSIVRSDGYIYEELYDSSKEIARVRRKDTVYVIKFKPYSNKYEVIHNHQIGYIKAKLVRPSKALKQIVQKTRTTNNYSSSLINSTTRKRRYTSRSYIRGPRGGCYYVNSNGNKTYVSRSMCN